MAVACELHLREAGTDAHRADQCGERASEQRFRACLVIGVMVRSRVPGLEFLQRQP